MILLPYRDETAVDISTSNIQSENKIAMTLLLRFCQFLVHHNQSLKNKKQKLLNHMFESEIPPPPTPVDKIDS